MRAKSEPGLENEKKGASTRDSRMDQKGTKRKEEGDGRALNTTQPPLQKGDMEVKNSRWYDNEAR